ncbi:MAG: hypothetical protein ACK5NN_08480 [Sphingomonadaceae bacterium]
MSSASFVVPVLLDHMAQNAMGAPSRLAPHPGEAAAARNNWFRGAMPGLTITNGVIQQIEG